jgi:hypothetical protein
LFCGVSNFKLEEEPWGVAGCFSWCLWLACFGVCFGVGNLRLEEGEVKVNSFSSTFRSGSAAGFFEFRHLTKGLGLEFALQEQ